MSAYMPAKQTWNLYLNRPLRSVTLRVAAFIAGAGIVGVIAGLAVLAATSGHGGSLEQLPTPAGNVLAKGVAAARDHGFLVVQGEAFNEGSQPTQRLEAVVELFDSHGSLRGVESALVEMPVVAVHEESPFVVHLQDPGQVTSYRVRFRPLASTTLR